MPEEKKDKQDRIIELLEEISKWTKVTNIPQVKKLLLDLLPDDRQKIAYHSSNGESSRKIAALAGVSHVDITKWWKAWIRAGIAEPLGVQRGERAKRTFSLEDFGIEVPQSRRMKHTENETKTSIVQESKEERKDE